MNQYKCVSPYYIFLIRKKNNKIALGNNPAVQLIPFGMKLNYNLDEFALLISHIQLSAHFYLLERPDSKQSLTLAVTDHPVCKSKQVPQPPHHTVLVSPSNTSDKLTEH